MASKIRIETDNKTRPGFAEATADLQKLADAAGITANVAKDLSKQLDKEAYKKYREEVARLSDEISGTGSALSETERRARDLNKELESRAAAKYRAEIKAMADEMDGTAAAARELSAAAADAGESIDGMNKKGSDGGSSHGSSVKAVIDLYGPLKDSIEVAGKALDYLAERGDKAAIAINRGFELAGEKIAQVAVHGRATQNVLHSLGQNAEQASTSIGKLADAISEQFARRQDGLKTFIIQQKEFLGLIDQQAALQAHLEIQNAEATHKRKEAARQVREAEELAASSIQGVIKETSEAAKKAAFERRVEDAGVRDMQQEIAKKIAETEKKIKEVATADGVTHRERMLSLEQEKQTLSDLIRLREHSKEVQQKAIKDVAEQQKKAAEDAAATERKAADEQEAAQRKSVEEAAKAAAIRVKIAADEAAKAKAIRDKAQAEMQAEAEAAAKRKFDGKFDGGGRDAVKENLAKQDPRAINRTIVDRREQEVRSSDEFRNGTTTARQRQQMVMAARRDAARDIRSGQVDPMERAEAQNQLAQQQITTAEKSGQMGAESVEFAREATKKVLRLQADLDAQAQEMESFRRAMLSSGNRTRGQRAGGG